MDLESRVYPPSDSNSDENPDSSDENPGASDENPDSLEDALIFGDPTGRRLIALDRAIDQATLDLRTAAFTVEQSQRHHGMQQTWLEGRRLMTPPDEREQFDRDMVYVEQLMQRLLTTQLTAEERCRTLVSQLVGYNQQRRMLVEGLRRAGDPVRFSIA